MKELKSRKTGYTSVCTEEEYAYIVNHKPNWLKRFIVTDLKSFKQNIPPVAPVEVSKPKKIKNEG